MSAENEQVLIQVNLDAPSESPCNEIFQKKEKRKRDKNFAQ